ncbi:hypothetical protein J6590_080368 [Homalodisca vitripennis]|nr:hypothetical protein J6590_080368 [Homalodisca vitripennis]
MAPPEEDPPVGFDEIGHMRPLPGPAAETPAGWPSVPARPRFPRPWTTAPSRSCLPAGPYITNLPLRHRINDTHRT